MIMRFAVCSERQGKPVTRRVCDAKPQAELELEEIKVEDAAAPEDSYWVAEVAADAEAWRWLARDEAKD